MKGCHSQRQDSPHTGIERIEMRWVPVVGYEGFYEVSEYGGVRSLPRYVNHWCGGQVLRKGRVLKQSTFNGRYMWLTLSREGTCKTAKIHVLVAAAFIGPRPPGKVIRHRDGNHKNNYYRNICYGTHQENSDDQKAHGTVLRGEDTTNAKLTDGKVRQIRKMLTTHTQASLAKKFGMSNQQISNIKLGYSWAHIK